MAAAWLSTIANVLKENPGMKYGDAMKKAKPKWAELKLARGEAPPKPASRLRGKQERPAVKKKKADVEKLVCNCKRKD